MKQTLAWSHVFFLSCHFFQKGLQILWVFLHRRPKLLVFHFFSMGSFYWILWRSCNIITAIIFIILLPRITFDKTQLSTSVPPPLHNFLKKILKTVQCAQSSSALHSQLLSNLRTNNIRRKPYDIQLWITIIRLRNSK